jgi:hypothetical protein
VFRRLHRERPVRAVEPGAGAAAEPGDLSSVRSGLEWPVPGPGERKAEEKPTIAERARANHASTEGDRVPTQTSSVPR